MLTCYNDTGVSIDRPNLTNTWKLTKGFNVEVCISNLRMGLFGSSAYNAILGLSG